jgi:hypothetical protein
MKKRFVFLKVPLGVLIIDRKTATWALVSGKVTIDYGSVRSRPEYMRYLPGRAVSSFQRSYDAGNTDGSD